jgi:hypothetical protein
MNSTSSKNIDNLQASVESWITNLDSLEIYSLDRALKPVLVIFYIKNKSVMF